MTPIAHIDALQLGEPVSHRGIVLTPLHPRRDPVAVYVTLEEGLAAGLRVTEVDAAGSVPELAVHNPGPHDVLLYDGEELLGAKQNRILDVSVLVAAGSQVVIPVSCVEQGRWSARSELFAAAPHSSHPALRRRKAERLAAADPGSARGAAQGEVWSEVAEKAARMAAGPSPSRAHADTYRDRDDDLRALARHFPVQPGQCGAVLALGGRPVVLDAVSRPGAWARLHDKLLAGYLLDALEALDGPPAPAEAIEAFTAAVLGAAAERRPGVGRGEQLHLSGEAVLGTGLALDGEVLQLSAYPITPGGGPRPGPRVARPSRRRP
jgi:hypothetical protein